VAEWSVGRVDTTCVAGPVAADGNTAGQSTRFKCLWKSLDDSAANAAEAAGLKAQPDCTPFDGAAVDPMLHGASDPFGQQSWVGAHSAQANAGKPTKSRLAHKNVRLKIRRNMIRA
jgi:hypothetical protein